MDYSDPPRPQRPSRYPAFPPHEDRYPQAGRPPWDDQAWPASTGAHGDAFSDGSAGAFGPAPSAGGFGQAASSGGFRTGPSTDAFHQASTGPFLSADTVADIRPFARERARPRRSRTQLVAGAVAGFLAAAVALGVANLTAAFVRPQASPIIAVGGAFIDRTPPALKNFAVEKFGENDKNMLLLGMYVTIALIALVVGMLAGRRLYIGVAGIGLFGLFGAFVAFTRPESQLTDVIPSIVGGIAGMVAIVLLIRATARRTSMPSRSAEPASGYQNGWAA